MQKNFSGSDALCVAMFVLSVAFGLWLNPPMAFGQSTSVNKSAVDARYLYEAVEAVPFLAGPIIGGEKTAAPSRVPGDSDPLFMVHAPVFVREDDRFLVRVITLKDIPSGAQIAGRVYYPGLSGVYDQDGRIGYLKPMFLTSDVKTGTTMKVYSTEISSEYGRGEHQLDLTMWGPDGSLLQQTFHSFSVIDSGPYGQSRHRVSSVALNSEGNGFDVVGVFTPGTTMRTWVGVIGDQWQTGKFTSFDGKTGFHYGTIGFPRLTSVDMIVLDQANRWSTTRVAATEVGFHK